MGTARKTEDATRLSVTLTPDLYEEIATKAKDVGVSLNRMIVTLLHSGIEAEKHRKQILAEKLERYRACTDEKEAERLGEDLGAMLFG